MERLTLFVLAALLLLPVGGSAPAAGADQIKVMAFGDSITEGDRPFDEEGRGGYPGRLPKSLRKRGLRDNEVINAGRGGETTSAGVFRMDFVLDQAGPGLTHAVIMEGTNDINDYFNGVGSIETTVFNLNQMSQKVKARGAKAILATIIPRSPNARRDRSNQATFELVVAIREFAARNNRDLAEPWELFASIGAPVFDDYYYQGSDPVGHPNAAGFQLLADFLADKLADIDLVPPVLSAFAKDGSESQLKARDTVTALVHESGEGIGKAGTFFTINGQPVETRIEGNRRRAELTYELTKSDLQCLGRIAVQSEDRADPPNVLNRLVAEYEIKDAKTIKGDVSGDCLVDGLDLSLMGVSFGAVRGEPRYSFAADTNNDRIVDGDDLAKLANNFGKSSN